MGQREAPLSLRLACSVLLAAALGFVRAAAQPSDLYTCLPDASPTCYDLAGPITITDCPIHFEHYYGRVAWYPLRCVGPITVSVETIASWKTTAPLYVEVVPLLANQTPCDNSPGYVVMMTHGTFLGCGGWESVGPIEISHVVPLGSNYALRLHFFLGPTGESPGVNCVRVDAAPARTPVAARTWASVKRLYR